MNKIDGTTSLSIGLGCITVGIVMSYGFHIPVATAFTFPIGFILIGLAICKLITGEDKKINNSKKVKKEKKYQWEKTREKTKC